MTELRTFQNKGKVTLVKVRISYIEHDKRFNFSGILHHLDLYKSIRRNILEECMQRNNPEELTRQNSVE